jgi:hypothetical protein
MAPGKSEGSKEVTDPLPTSVSGIPLCSTSGTIFIVRLRSIKLEAGMDIKRILDKELRATEQAKKEKEKSDIALEQEAANLFQPIVSAMEQLKSELSSYPGIQFTISNHFVTVRLGEDTSLECHRYGWSQNFVVDETNTIKYPEFEVLEQNHKFDDVETFISFIVKRCAEYVVNIKK